MKISGIATVPCSYNAAFLGQKFSLSNRYTQGQKEFEKRQAELNKEAAQAQKARGREVNVPKYKVSTTEDGHVRQIRYETKGDIADIKTNPVRSKHFRSLFKNLYFMDRASIFHNDLDPSHIFFNDDGQVEFDCFRYSVNFYKNRNGQLKGNDGSIRTPDFMFPSNEDTLKEHFLGGYVDKLDEDDRFYFVKNYLMNKSDYHQRRGDLLVNRGFDPDGKTVRFEDIQSRVFLNPSNQVINYEIKKLDNYKLKRDAFTEWDEGGGACGHKVEPQRRFNAILLNLDCIESAMDLRNEAQYLARYAITADEKEYFKLETECAQRRLDDLYNDTKGMGSWKFNDSEHGIYLGTQDEKEFFLALFDEFSPSDILAEGSINNIREFYEGLKERWNKDLNALYIEEAKNS